jgi:hypothetical protein
MNSTRLIMTNGAATMPMPAGYMFQRSEIYRYYDPQKGPHNAVISNPAPGVFINAVFGQGSTLMMRASPDSRLLPMCSLGRTLLASSTKWAFARQPIPSQFSPDFPNSKGLGLSQQYD